MRGRLSPRSKTGESCRDEKRNGTSALPSCTLRRSEHVFSIFYMKTIIEWGYDTTFRLRRTFSTSAR